MCNTSQSCHELDLSHTACKCEECHQVRNTGKTERKVCVRRGVLSSYVAGKVARSVHGNNRLGRNLFLDRVRFGRVAGVACAKYMLGDKLKATSLHELLDGGLSGNAETSKLAGGSCEDIMNFTPAAANGASYNME